LFELFVAEWLRAHLPPEFRLAVQENVLLGEQDDLRFRIDLVLYRTGQDLPLCVIDTKYKKPDQPSTTDIQAMVAYSESKGCTEAVLVYPTKLKWSGAVRVRTKRVRALTFNIQDDLEAGGRQFLDHLLAA